MSAPEIMVVAGEASGDAHAAELVAALKRSRPELRFFGMGGPRLAAQHVDLLYGAHEISVMGLVEVLPKLRRILEVMRGLERAAERRRPVAAILVDIPDFNLRLAPRLRALGTRIAYYVSPMVWAWRQGRVRQIGDCVDRMLCILPFEEKFYRGSGVKAQYVGSPVLEQMPALADASVFRTALGLKPSRPTLAVLPGSRMSEIRRLLPTMMRAAKEIEREHAGLQVVIPVAPTIPRAEIEARLQGVDAVMIDGRAPEVVGASDAAIVASGTAALEAALMRRPMVVVYRVSPTTYVAGRLMLKVPFVSLPNLLAGRRVVPELLQGAFTPRRTAEELGKVWSGPAREEMLRGLDEVRAALGKPGAAERAAKAVLELIPLPSPQTGRGTG